MSCLSLNSSLVDLGHHPPVDLLRGTSGVDRDDPLAVSAGQLVIRASDPTLKLQALGLESVINLGLPVKRIGGVDPQ
jgi:hypothetical protein